jgi:hypothetical protein
MKILKKRPAGYFEYALHSDTVYTINFKSFTITQRVCTINEDGTVDVLIGEEEVVTVDIHDPDIVTSREDAMSLGDYFSKYLKG